MNCCAKIEPSAAVVIKYNWEFWVGDMAWLKVLTVVAGLNMTIEL
jgi:hypothetical protein